MGAPVEKHCPPPLSDFTGDVAELVSLLPGLFVVKCRGIDCRPGGMPRLVRQVDLLEGSVTNYVCLNKVDLRASPSEEVLPSKLSSLPSNPEWVFVAKMGVSGSHCQSLLSPLLLPKRCCKGAMRV